MMRKKTSPSSRPARRPLRPRLGKVRGPAETGVDKRPTTFVGKLRGFGPGVAIADALIALVVIALAFVGIMFTGSPLSMFPSVIAELWMISHLAPVVFEGVTVSVTPMLPALGVIAVVAARVRTIVRRKVSVFDLGVIFGVALVVPLLLTIIAWLMLLDAGNVYPVAVPPILDALVSTALVHLVAFVVGVGVKLWRAILRRYRLSGDLATGARTGATAMGGLCVAAVLVLIVFGLFGWERQSEMLAAYPNADGFTVVALVVLTILYLPNVAVSMASVLLGGDVTFGDASISLFSIHLVPLPPLPLAAVIPGEAHPLAPVLMLVTALVVSYVWGVAKPRMAQVLGGAVSAGLVMLVSGYLAGGQLGWYGHVGPTWWLAPALAVVWVAALGLGTVGALVLNERRHASAAAGDEAPEEGDEAVEEPEADLDDAEAKDPADPPASAGEATGEEEGKGGSAELQDEDEAEGGESQALNTAHEGTVTPADEEGSEADDAQDSGLRGTADEPEREGGASRGEHSAAGTEGDPEAGVGRGAEENAIPEVGEAVYKEELDEPNVTPVGDEVGTGDGAGEADPEKSVSRPSTD